MKTKNKKNSNTTSCEFKFKRNGNIICKWFFTLDGRVNKNLFESYDIKDMMDELMSEGFSKPIGIIPNVIKERCSSITWNQSYLKHSDNKVKDDFTLDLTANRSFICSGYFDGNIFQKYSKSDIDIRDITDEITEVMKSYMVKKDYVKDFNGVALKKLNVLSSEEKKMLTEYHTNER